jgi:hypothetical protein
MTLLIFRGQKCKFFYFIDLPLPLCRRQQLTNPSIAPSRSRTFNPTAPIFLPRTQSQPPIGPSRFPPPSPNSSKNTPYHQDPHQNHTGGINSTPMSPTNSGGVRIGRRLIGFGDFPEMVDSDLARERAERQRADRKAFGDDRFRGNPDRNSEWQPRRPRLLAPNGQVPPSTPAQGRSSSDVEESARNGNVANSGRRRGLSSSDEAVGLGIGTRRPGSGYSMAGYEQGHSGLGESIFNDGHEMHLSGVARV